MARILIIDDEENIREMLQLTLEHAGHTVTVAEDGPSGLKAFGDGSNTDLVVLDQKMPGMDGSEVHKEIRKRNPAARVVICTAFGTLDTALESLKGGAVDFLRKPFTSAALVNAIDAALKTTPAEVHAVPANEIIRAMGRTTINGFTSTLIDSHVDERTHGWVVRFDVGSPDGQGSEIAVKIPTYVLELAKAYADCEHVPGNQRFWSAMAEEALLGHLMQYAALPENNELLVDDLNSNLRRWLDAVLTVQPTTTPSLP